MELTDWYLTAAQRGNPATVLDRRHGDGAAWTTGNQVTPLVHGATYFGELLASVRALEAGDLMMFADWRGDPDQRLAGIGTEVGTVFCEAAARGVVVRGLIWRSHLDRFQFSASENRHLGTEIEAAGGKCLLDMRVRSGGSHHQKFVVLRHPGRPELDVAFVGGIDLCHGRRDDADHGGDPQRQPMAKVYGDRPPWHDIQVAIRGPAVGDVEAVFRERWDDPTPLSRNPLHVLRDRMQHTDTEAGRLPAQLSDPAPVGTHAVQVLRTYGYRRRGYPFAPRGERSVARGYLKAVQRARSLIYLEDQYLWSDEVADLFADALQANQRLHLIAVLPRFPDQDGKVSMPPNLVGRESALHAVQRAGGDRVGVYGLENPAGTPVYVHAKTCVIDDLWAAVGSDNLNRRSWTHDSELSVAVIDETPDGRSPADPASVGDGARRYARDLRLRLAREHLDRAEDAGDEELLGAEQFFEAFAGSAARLDEWYAGGRAGTRPPGRLRRYPVPHLSAATRAWATPLYRVLYDPDGRPADLRRRRTF